MGEHSKNLRSRANILGANRIGFCVICGTHGKLTADHVPPKGCGVLPDVILRPLMSADGTLRGPKIQGGVKFRTICGGCNNTLLGTLYDPELKVFVTDMLTQIMQTANQVYARFVHIKIRTPLVIRALIGHMLAAHAVQETLEKRESLGANDSLRDYLLNPTATFPKDWRLYCWPYLSRQQVILKHAVLSDLSNFNLRTNPLYGHVIKFLPLGFWFVHDQPSDYHISAFEITPPYDAETDFMETIIFNLNERPHFLFPETPQGNQMLAFADHQSSVASPTTK
ncbi:hypothetical protein ACIPF8_10655 [Collimonas sp. NPDC087041]|uniref:hypothetical protein n=1 Tax=Collimonas sp. NPDC087041 TaxID=3363960 RepID=UPI003808F056